MGQRYDILHLLNRGDAVLNGLGVLSTGLSQDILDLVDVRLSPVLVRLFEELYIKRKTSASITALDAYDDHDTHLRNDTK